MLVIGLTGPTGAGKGEFGRLAREEFGALHIDTDRTAREVVEPGKPCLDALVKTFGSKILAADGSLDRRALGGIVFADKEKLQTLNAVTHPFITKEVRRTLEDAETRGITLAVIDAPLLFEAGEDAICDVTVGVVAPERVRLARILARDGVTEKAARSRIASGKSTAFFASRCDVLLANAADLASFTAASSAVLRALLSR